MIFILIHELCLKFILIKRNNSISRISKTKVLSITKSLETDILYPPMVNRIQYLQSPSPPDAVSKLFSKGIISSLLNEHCSTIILFFFRSLSFCFKYSFLLNSFCFNRDTFLLLLSRNNRLSMKLSFHS